MKSLNKRTRTIAAIVGVLVIAAVAITIFGQAGGSELFGASGAFIDPSNPTLHVGDSTWLSVNSNFNCYWTRFGRDKDVVLFSSPTTFVVHVQIQADHPGEVMIQAHCGFLGLGQEPSTIVTVE